MVGGLFRQYGLESFPFRRALRLNPRCQVILFLRRGCRGTEPVPFDIGQHLEDVGLCLSRSFYSGKGQCVHQDPKRCPEQTFLYKVYVFIGKTRFRDIRYVPDRVVMDFIFRFIVENHRNDPHGTPFDCCRAFRTEINQYLRQTE